MKFDVSWILDDLKAGARSAAKEAGTAFLQEASHVALAFVQASVPQVQRYINLFLTKQISQEELESLMNGLKDNAELNGLTIAGIAAIEADKTKNSIVKAVTSIVIGAVGKIS